MKVYAGIDLHSTNNYVGILDQEGKKLFGKRLPNHPSKVLLVLNQFKDVLDSVVIESTYNWYWLVDMLKENGFDVRLANPAAIQQFSGLKYTDDESDAYWLANLKRLNILKEGYIYPRDMRPTRDMLRRRLMFVHQRTAHILSLQSLITRQLALNYTGEMVKRLRERTLEEMFGESDFFTLAKSNRETIAFLGLKIKHIEKKVIEKVKLKPEFVMLTTIPGIGDILGITIMLEVGEVSRFAKVGNYSSYCRCVNSLRMSNAKKKGTGNRKNGNKYLAWAYVEAANHALRLCPEAHRFYQKKRAKSMNVIAIKALSNKLARASYYLMRDKVKFDAKKLFN
ncbi:MAG: IS110 family transposase [Bacteroidetes bacterium]|nr:IS110 family transposase [Bacteroidota bacterium]